MAGKLPDRPRCPAHPYSILQRDGSCFHCEGEKLAQADTQRAGSKRAMKFNFKGRNRRRADDLPDDEYDYEGEEQLDGELATA